MTRLLSYHQITPSYLPFLFVFGLQEGPADPLFADFVSETSNLDNPLSALSIPSLGRSGRQYQLCFNVKAPAWIASDSAWSIRQVGAHHQFDVETGKALWMMTRGGTDIYERIRNLTDAYGRPEDRDVSTAEATFRGTLPIFLMLAFWALEQWEAYLRYLESLIKERVNFALRIMHNLRC